MKTQAATRLLADWWSDLGPDGQSKYISDHPNSEKAKDAKEAAEKTGTPPPTQKVEKKTDQANGDQKPKQKPLAPGRPLSEFAKSKDDPSITVDKIFAKLKPSDAHEMKMKTKEAMGLDPSDRQFTTHNGEYTPERKALHDKILKSFLSPDRIKAATPEKGTKPTFVVLGGRGGSGKSAFTSENGKPAVVNEFDSTKFLTLDADAIKEMLNPPYEGWNANQVHEESSYLFDKIFDAAKKMGLNIVSDATLKSDKMGPVLEDMIGKGYDVEGHYMFLPRQKAAERACGRYLKDGPQNRGRLVPPDVILGNTNNEANFDKLKQYFKRFSCYNNDVERGQPPQLIDHSDYAQPKQAEQAPPKKGNKMESRVQTKTVAGAGYTADDWENDPFLGQNPDRNERVRAESFATMQGLGIRTGQIIDPAERAAYTKFLRGQV
jgi:predicted ABC-type ATPase